MTHFYGVGQVSGDILYQEDTVNNEMISVLFKIELFTDESYRTHTAKKKEIPLVTFKGLKLPGGHAPIALVYCPGIGPS